MLGNSRGLALIAAAASLSMGGPIYINSDPTMDLGDVQVRPKRRPVSAQAPAKFGRSKGPQAKPKRKSNRLHLSRRTKRKHRRAA